MGTHYKWRAEPPALIARRKALGNRPLSLKESRQKLWALESKGEGHRGKGTFSGGVYQDLVALDSLVFCTGEWRGVKKNGGGGTGRESK